MIVTLDPGSYTAILRGKNNTSGVALVEAYDLDGTVDSKLANISTRGLVQTGDNVMVAGMIVLGGASQRVIVRALGPSLSMPGKRADPTLDNNVVAKVKTWRFRPLMANGTPVPFCYFGRFEFKSE